MPFDALPSAGNQNPNDRREAKSVRTQTLVLDAYAQWALPVAAADLSGSAPLAARVVTDERTTTVCTLAATAVDTGELPSIRIDFRPLAYPLASGVPRAVHIPHEALCLKLRESYQRQWSLTVQCPSGRVVNVGGVGCLRPWLVSEALLNWACRQRPEWHAGNLQGALPEWGRGTQFTCPEGWYKGNMSRLRGFDDGAWGARASRETDERSAILKRLFRAALSERIPARVGDCAVYPGASSIEIEGDSGRLVIVATRKGSTLHDVTYSASRQQTGSSLREERPLFVRCERYPCVSQVMVGVLRAQDARWQQREFEHQLERWDAACVPPKPPKPRTTSKPRRLKKDPKAATKPSKSRSRKTPPKTALLSSPHARGIRPAGQ